MSKSNRRVEYNGAGIFGRINANKNETDNEQQATTFNENSQLQTSIEQTQVTNATVCHLPTKQLNQIFANIEKQAEALNKLHSKQRLDQSNSTDNHNINKVGHHNWATPRRARRSSSSTSTSELLAKGERQQQLHYYINHSIKGELDDCSCCYRFDSSDRHLLNELSECYRQAGDSRKSSVSPASTSVNCYECRQRQHNNEPVCLAQPVELSSYRAANRPSFDKKQGYASLFIENNDPHWADDTGQAQSTQITDYSASDCQHASASAGYPSNQTIETNNNTRQANCCSCCCHHDEPTVTFPSESTSCAPAAAPPATTSNLEYSVLASSGYNYIFGPANGGDESPVSETGNALDRVADSPQSDQHNWPQEQQDYQATYQTTNLEHPSYIGTLSSANLEQPSEQFAFEEAHLECSLTYKSSQSPELQTQSDCSSAGEKEEEELSCDFIATTATSTRPPKHPHWTSRNSSRSESNLASLLLFCDPPTDCHCNSRRPQREASLVSVSHERLDQSDEIFASQSNLESKSELSFRKMGPDGNGNYNGNEFISDKASKLLGISPARRHNSASAAASSSLDGSHCGHQQQATRAANLMIPTEANKRQQHLRETDRHHQSSRTQDFSSLSSRAIGPDAAAPPTTSMRAARDIAKMSVPSLSSLQYLPGKVGVSAKKVSNNSSDTPTKENINKTDDARSPLCQQQQQQQHMAGGGRKALSASNDDVQHDESSFLHRLCLCNCMAHHHQHQQRPTELAQVVSGPKSAATRSLSRSSEGLTSSGDHNNTKRKSRKQRLSSSDDNQRNDAKRMRHQEDEETSGEMQTSQQRAARQRARRDLPDTVEKQSPKFHGLLRSTPSSNKTLKSVHGGRGHAETLKRLGPGSLGSDGDLVASLSQELENSATTNEFDGSEGSSASPRRPRSTLSATLTDDGSCLNGVASSSSPLSAKSAHSPTARHKKTSTYKKFLSPSKLFGGSQASNLSDTNHEPALAGVEKRAKSGDEPSFLSRSLNRLSGRKKSTSKQHRQPADQEDSRRAPPDCTSPTISISNTSQQESYTESVNSLEDISLPHSLPAHRTHGRVEATKSRLLTAPEIVLNKVEYTDDRSEYSTRSACDMTRSSNAHNHSHRRHYGRVSPARQGSGYSDSIGDSASLQGPFSLPGSPRSARRHRSPRLSQSPVPFRSPASESSKIEDGLKVCSTEHFEKHIGNIKENQMEAQKRLFTAWINHFCPNLIRRDLVDELQDGIKLIGLLASLTHDKSLLANYEKLNRDKQSYVNRLVVTPSSRLKHLSNVSMAVDYLRKELGMQLVNLNPMDIVSGKANVILGLCWNIILHFQLEQNFFKFPDGLSDSYSASSDLSPSCTSRLSSGATNEDRSGRRNIGQMIRGTSASLMEEYSTRDLLTAKNRLLDHINKRFNLKLTKLSSNLVDGDVLLVIIKQLLPQTAASELTDIPGERWKEMNDDEKLDHCFHLANKHLDVPQLFSASDLRQQSLSENSSKPLLIYLSMLLSSNPNTCSPEQMVELQQVGASLTENQQADNNNRGQDSPTTADVELLLRDIDTPDKYDIDKLQTTLEKMKKVDELMATEQANQQLAEPLLSRHAQLKEEANQVESLIGWINRADKLFEMSQKSSVDLAKAINEYQSFFSPGNLPQVSVVLCPTLERQYRECLATAKQRVLSMEQTMKNWLTYEQARQELKDWLLSAESKLSNALRPGHQQPNGYVKESMEPIEQHLSRLEELIDYFELEQLDVDDSLLFSSLDHSMSTSSLNIGQSSLSGSLNSLGSTSSRLSTLTSSKKATYNRLFDDFELKCRLLAAMLDSDQRDALLLGVKELKSRLKYITEYRVPQVVNELRININRCELSIQEQDESSEHENRESNLESESCESDKKPDIICRPQEASDVVSDDVSEEQAGEQEETPVILKTIKPLNKRKNRNKNKSRNNKNTVTINDSNTKKKNKAAATGVVKEPTGEPSKKPSYIRLFWNKLVRASRVSLSLNIVLLLCLAGICVVPLINRDACCELSQKTIPSSGFSIDQKPT